jgi:Mg2+ and Co2+ transporter CorA
VHFHRAALLSLSDQLAVAMNRLVVGDTESVKRFKRGIRRAMEVFLRFTHRYWYHEVSDQDLARSLFSRLARHLDNETLYDEVRHEMLDMSDYLDSDSMRRQANTILRLTVVTIFAMIATIGTGFLGMNLIAAADQPFLWRVVFFLIVLVVTGGITAFTIIRSKRLADLLDVLSDERVAPRLKLRACLDSWRK